MKLISIALVTALGFTGCGKAEDAKDKAADKAHDVADKAHDVADKARNVADDVGEEAVALAGKASGLGADIVAALTPGALAVAGGIEDVVLRGKQVGGVANEIGGVWSEAVDSDTTIKPIYQKLDDEEAKRATDAAIGDMPRTEVIDGLTVGFKDLTLMENAKRTTDSGYLVVWRQDDRLIGFVYHSKRSVDFDLIVEETPRLIAMVKKLM